VSPAIAATTTTRSSGIRGTLPCPASAPAMMIVVLPGQKKPTMIAASKKTTGATIA
jgi:hypothetical protein